MRCWSYISPGGRCIATRLRCAASIFNDDVYPGIGDWPMSLYGYGHYSPARRQQSQHFIPIPAILSSSPPRLHHIRPTQRGAGVPPFRLCSSLVHSLPHLLLFITFSLFLFSFTLLIFFYWPSDPFLPESSHSVSRREVIGGGRTWV